MSMVGRKVSPCISIYDTLMAGTHDSAAYTARPDLLSRTAPSLMSMRSVRAITSRIQAEFALTQRLSIAEQLEAGARFLDLRISKRADTPLEEDTFWTVHGMVLCVPLDDVLRQLAAFHTNNVNTRDKPVVLAVRTYELSEREVMALGKRIISKLGSDNVYIGDRDTLGTIPLDELPRFILAGIPPSRLAAEWGVDIWTDTYSSDKKIAFLEKSLHSSPPKCINTNRKGLLVLGWTVTPNVVDVVLRWFSFGILRRTVLEEAVDMNALFGGFIDDHRKEIADKVHVVFFDSFEESLAETIADIAAGDT